MLCREWLFASLRVGRGSFNPIRSLGQVGFHWRPFKSKAETCKMGSLIITVLFYVPDTMTDMDLVALPSLHIPQFSYRSPIVLPLQKEN